MSGKIWLFSEVFRLK